MAAHAADLIFTNANAITMENDLPKASTVAVKGKVITYVGNNCDIDDFKDRHTRIIDLNGKTLIPGFIESHMHSLLFGTNLLQLDCRSESTGSIDDILAVIKKSAITTPEGQWILGWGWDDVRLKEKRFPNRWDLDKVSPNHPVFLKRTCVHMAAVNSKALELSNIDSTTPDPEGGHIDKDPDTGQPTGLLQESAMDLLSLPEYSLNDYKRGVELALTKFAQLGITTTSDMSAGFWGIRAYQQLSRENKLTARMRLWPTARDELGFKGILKELVAAGFERGFGNDMINLQGLKFFLDGSIGGKTAAIAEPYEGESDNYGILYSDVDGIAPHIIQTLNAGLRVAIHAIGERAIEVALKSLERANTEIDMSTMRNRIEHCILPTEDQLDRIKKLNLVVGSSVAFMYALGDSYLLNLGPERVKRAFPYHAYKKRGIVAPGNSDCPVDDVNPLVSMYAGVSRKTIGGATLGREQAMSIMEALKAFTMDAAYSTFDEHIIGSIKKDKYADLVVLSEDPLKVPEDSLKDIEVELTMMNGKEVYRS